MKLRCYFSPALAVKKKEKKKIDLTWQNRNPAL